MKFLTEQKIFYLKEFSFRKKFSTAPAITNLIDSIKNAIDQNKFACGVFIDLKKAFDAVDHEILLKKLWQYGIRKYLGVFIDENLNWVTPINETSTKLIKGNTMLSKLWYFALNVFCYFSSGVKLIII